MHAGWRMRDGPRALQGVAMGQAVWRAAPVLPAGRRSEVAREIAFGHVLGRVYPIKFFFSFLFAGAAAPKRRS